MESSNLAEHEYVLGFVPFSFVDSLSSTNDTLFHGFVQTSSMRKTGVSARLCCCTETVLSVWTIGDWDGVTDNQLRNVWRNNVE